MKFIVLFYRSILSSKKGFSCAHNRVNGTGSCSDWALRIIENRGSLEFVRKLPRRFSDCHKAHLSIIQDEKDDNSDKNDDKPAKCCVASELFGWWYNA